MGNKTPTQLSFEQKLKDMNVPLPVHYEGVRSLSAALTIVHPENADETYVVMTRTGGFVTALMLSKTPFPSRYDVPVTDSLESVVIIDVKEHRVISVAVYTK